MSWKKEKITSINATSDLNKMNKKWNPPDKRNATGNFLKGSHREWSNVHHCYIRKIEGSIKINFIQQ